MPLLLWGMPGLATELEQELIEGKYTEVFFETAQPLPLISSSDNPFGQIKQNTDSATTRQTEANRLLVEGAAQYDRSEWQAALTIWQKALEGV
ncbi:hypothetical protein IQ265_27940 [Nodosilinea sp. LEGE 06152]|uniref:hypothetical protein n=1 Tax=Nodosilinea sp. LEGE 06152 TaxID=2777966 RepID=UPI001880439B|nr:hypothetical protein [Nodosilinea sp. LEGE 06152]MBE9160624.1 hypothetical protein [Nodosilinea sp. LEGE 06152]